MSKRAQGLPIRTIVIAAIAMLVLVLVIAFFLGVLTPIFKETREIAGATEADVVAAQTKCSQLCIQARGISEPTKWSSSGYCIWESDEKDWDGDGAAEKLHCWEAPINNFCSATISGVEKSEVDC